MSPWPRPTPTPTPLRGGHARPAQRWWRDTDYDAEAEGPVIGEIMGRAEAWAEETGWRLD